jgi:wyosine [tRNA(Phe)-imidazoG37] synthetase (radical SAM superfamily)
MPPNPLFHSHPRAFERLQYVYPVLSRRAGGISIGVNLNRDQFCNFNCVYCQVVRSGKRGQSPELKGDSPLFPSGTKGTVHFFPLDLQVLAEELDTTVERFDSGALFENPPFRQTPRELRRLSDIAFSGDGEPTAHPLFGEAVSVAAEIRRRHGLDALKLVLITNASLLHQAPVRQALEVLDRNHGEIWAKLDAGTETYYRQVARTQVAFEQILANLREAAQVRPIVIQSLFMNLHEVPPPRDEIEAYCRRLGEILASGGKIQTVQIYTVARLPAEPWVTPLSNSELDQIAATVQKQTGLPVTAYYGYSSDY